MNIPTDDDSLRRVVCLAGVWPWSDKANVPRAEMTAATNYLMAWQKLYGPMTKELRIAVSDLNEELRLLRHKLAAADSDKAAIREACVRVAKDHRQTDTLDTDYWQGYNKAVWDIEQAIRALDLAQRTAER